MAVTIPIMRRTMARVNPFWVLEVPSVPPQAKIHSSVIPVKTGIQ